MIEEEEMESVEEEEIMDDYGFDAEVTDDKEVQIETESMNENDNTEVLESLSSNKQSKSEWFKQPEKSPLITTKFYKIRNVCEGGILGWKYDKDKDLIAVKRTGGIQYFGLNFKEFSTLPRCEINTLSQLNMVNRSSSDRGRFFEDTVRKELRYGFN